MYQNNSIKHQAIRFSISHLFALSLNVKVDGLKIKQFYGIHTLDPITCYHSGTDGTWER